MNYKLSQLDNGAKLLLVPDKNSEVCTLMVFFAVGSRNETPAINGISHFIEHLLFKGSAKRPHYLDLSKALDSLGAEYNAFTAKDMTAYYIKFAKSKLTDAVDILSDMVRRPIFADHEINQERGVIIQEIKMYEDNPSWYIDDVFESLLFANHTLGSLIIGPRQVIKTVSPTTIRNYYKKYYTPTNMLVAVAGGYNEQVLTKLLNQDLGNKNWLPGKTVKLNRFVSKQVQAREKVLKKDTQQVQLAIGYPSVAMRDNKIFTQAVLATLLGGTMSSRLFVEIREKLGLAYSIGAKIEQYADAGAFMIKMGLDADKLIPATKVLQKELTRITSELPDLDELNRAKDSLLGHYTLRLESASGRMQYLAKQIVLQQKIIQPQDFKANIEKVSQTDIRKFAQQVFNPKKLNVSLIGPFRDGKKIIKNLVN